MEAGLGNEVLMLTIVGATARELGLERDEAERIFTKARRLWQEGGFKSISRQEPENAFRRGKEV